MARRLFLYPGTALGSVPVGPQCDCYERSDAVRTEQGQSCAVGWGIGIRRESFALPSESLSGGLVAVSCDAKTRCGAATHPQTDAGSRKSAERDSGCGGAGDYLHSAGAGWQRARDRRNAVSEYTLDRVQKYDC